MPNTAKIQTKRNLSGLSGEPPNHQFSQGWWHFPSSRSRQILTSSDARLWHHSSSINRVLAALVGDDTRGAVDFDMKSLHLRLADRQAQHGEGLTTAELVLSLDLACLSASLCRLGTHRRFLVHDSPREGDLELHIYHRLFEFVLELERSFGKREPSFQYIVTTTTPPPKSLASAPYTIATLTSKKTSGLLLKSSF